MAAVTLQRYRVLEMDFDTRAMILTGEIGDGWEPQVKEQWRQNKEKTRAAIAQEFGVFDLERKIDDFKAIGVLPFSVLGFHNRFHREARRAFVAGAYYPALTAACALGERILNHLIERLYPHFSDVDEAWIRQNSQKWPQLIRRVESWGVWQEGVRENYLRLMELRHKSLHFNMDTESRTREEALEALTLMSEIVANQFGSTQDHAWVIEGTPGVMFIKKDFETHPYVREIIIPSARMVGPSHSLEWTGSQFVVDPGPEHQAEVDTDEAFVEAWKEAPKR